MNTRGFEQLFAELDALEHQIEAGLYEGLVDGAEQYEAGMKETPAYVGMSGATRVSTTAYVVGPGHADTGAIEQAYDRAAALLTGFEGHAGQAFLTDAAGPGDDAFLVVGTVPTDYQIKLETLKAGEKAFVGLELDRQAGSLFEAANNGLRRRLR